MHFDEVKLTINSNHPIIV